MKIINQVCVLSVFLMVSMASAACWERQVFQGEKWENDLIVSSKIPTDFCFHPKQVILNARGRDKHNIVLRAMATPVPADDSSFYTNVGKKRAIFVSYTLFNYEESSGGLELKRLRVYVSMRVDPDSGEILDAPKLSAMLGQTDDSFHTKPFGNELPFKVTP